MKNKYIFIDEENSYNYGQITEVMLDVILVKLELGPGPPVQKLYHLTCLAHTNSVIFDTRKELLDFITYIETPSEEKDNVVKLKDKH